MPIKNYKPNTPGTRGMSTLVNSEITKSTPEKSLLVKKSKKGGRNNFNHNKRIRTCRNYRCRRHNGQVFFLHRV